MGTRVKWLVSRYIGPTKLGEGTWVGIELDLPTGENDGSVNVRTTNFPCHGCVNSSQFICGVVPLRALTVAGHSLF